jgi:hypothetical protein
MFRSRENWYGFRADPVSDAAERGEMEAQVSRHAKSLRMGDTTMTGKTRAPGGQPASTETPQPKQQMQDDGGHGPTNFGNINPTGEEDFTNTNDVPE